MALLSTLGTYKNEYGACLDIQSVEFNLHLPYTIFPNISFIFYRK